MLVVRPAGPADYDALMTLARESGHLRPRCRIQRPRIGALAGDIEELGGLEVRIGSGEALLREVHGCLLLRFGLLDVLHEAGLRFRF